MGVPPAKARSSRARKSTPAPSPPLPGSLDAVILSLSAQTALCRILNTGEELFLRTEKLWMLIPGEIATIKPARKWTYGGKPYLSGSIESTLLDARAIGLTPLRLQPFGDWDPAEEYWGEPGDPIPAWARKIIRRGRRPQFEMEQILPNENTLDGMDDPICRSNDLKQSGHASAANDILMGLCRADLRCLDAHSHLGNLSFDSYPNDAIRHYAVGLRIGELSLPEGFSGVLPWGLIDNRPFLRCLHGYAICLWRLDRFEESLAALDRILWLNPSDNQGIRLIIDDVRRRRIWRPED